jgi:hypothetical protein
VRSAEQIGIPGENLMAKSEAAMKEGRDTEMRRQILCVLVELRDEESGERLFRLTADCEQLAHRLFDALEAKGLLKLDED